jgi:hypothetical protein
VYIDKKKISSNPLPDQYQEGPVYLAAGVHALRIDYQKPEGAYPTLILYWTPPNQEKEKVPYNLLLAE